MGAAPPSVQMAISPYEVLVHVVWETLGHYWPTDAANWRDVVRDDRRLDVRPLAPLHPASRLIPEWMSPPPAVGENTLAGTLSQVRAAEPGAAGLTRALEDFWDKHVSVRWPRIRSIVEREVALVGASLLTQPSHEALSHLHPRVSFTEGEMVVHGTRSTLRTDVSGRRIVLVPTVGADDAIGVSLDEPGVVRLAYPARGSAELWNGHPQTHEGELRALLGAARAALLVRLRTPATTSALAETLQASPAAVSFHLQALVRMGLVDKLRRGRLVFYRHTGRGAALVALFLDG